MIYVNGVSKTIGTSGDKELGIYADFYYKIGTNEIDRFITTLLKIKDVLVDVTPCCNEEV